MEEKKIVWVTAHINRDTNLSNARPGKVSLVSPEHSDKKVKQLLWHFQRATVGIFLFCLFL